MLRFFSTVQPGASIPKAVWKVSHQMPMRSGRLEKRARLAIPVRIASLKEPSAGERSTTENICSLGIRVLVRHARKLNERLLIKSTDGELQTDARVVYCERLLDGRFALGLEFHGEVTNWVKKSMGDRD
jgi:hypothetical protein